MCAKTGNEGKPKKLAKWNSSKFQATARSACGRPPAKDKHGCGNHSMGYIIPILSSRDFLKWKFINTSAVHPSIRLWSNAIPKPFVSPLCFLSNERHPKRFPFTPKTHTQHTGKNGETGTKETGNGVNVFSYIKYIYIYILTETETKTDRVRGKGKELVRLQLRHARWK